MALPAVFGLFVIPGVVAMPFMVKAKPTKIIVKVLAVVVGFGWLSALPLHRSVRGPSGP